MEPLRFTFKAQGHPNITAGHRTTVMITRDSELTRNGDCIVGVNAEMGLTDLPLQVKAAIRAKGSSVKLTLQAGCLIFQMQGRGHPDLPLDHPDDMVARKSRYICGRTLMIEGDKGACNIFPELISVLQEGDREITVIIEVTM
jgi:hypothetical protein